MPGASEPNAVRDKGVATVSIVTFPFLSVQVIEIDPTVVELASKFFGVSQDAAFQVNSDDLYIQVLRIPVRDELQSESVALTFVGSLGCRVEGRRTRGGSSTDFPGHIRSTIRGSAFQCISQRMRHALFRSRQ